jgi:hypothetical protein
MAILTENEDYIKRRLPTIRIDAKARMIAVGIPIPA